MTDRIGQQLGNYRLTALVGEGGFAEVYLGEHIHLRTKAAVKVLHTQLTNEDVDAFRTEARTIAHLTHPHIIRVLEFGIEGRIPFLVMDYALKGTLRKLHPKGTSLALSTIVTYVKQVADALQYAHNEKLIHRDIKPDNMLVGRRNEVFLSDFGIALVAQSSRYQSAQEMAGTMAYMAPEQIQGKPRPASDQYSLGIVVYEWLTGDRPFHGSFTELVGQHLSAVPPSLHEKISTISPEVDQVVQIALAKDPKQRFASVQTFATALEQANRLGQSQLPMSSAGGVTPASQPLSLTIPATPSNLPPTLGQTNQSKQNQPSLSLPITPSSSQPFPPSGLITPPNPSSQRTTETPPPGYPSHVPTRQLTSRPSRRTVIAGLVGLTLVGSGITWFVASRSSISSSTPGTSPTALPLGATLIYRGHSSSVNSVAWSPDGKRIASASYDNTVQVWIALDGSNLYTYKAHSYYSLDSVAWSPNGKRMASAEDKMVQVWDANDGHNVFTYKGHSHLVRSVAWSPNGKYIASGADVYDKTVQVWDATDGSNVFTYRGHNDAVRSVTWSPNGKRIASGSNDRTVQVWDIADGSNVFIYRGHSDFLNSVAWSPDGKRIASASDDKTVQVWDATDGSNVFTYRGHNDAVWSVAWSPDGKLIASGATVHDKTVQVWDATDGSNVFTYRGHSDKVISVAWSPDGKHIASGSDDKTVQVWVAS